MAFSDGFLSSEKSYRRRAQETMQQASRWFRVTTNNRDVRAERDYNDPRLRVSEETWTNKMRVVQQYTGGR